MSTETNKSQALIQALQISTSQLMKSINSHILEGYIPTLSFENACSSLNNTYREVKTSLDNVDLKQAINDTEKWIKDTQDLIKNANGEMHTVEIEDLEEEIKRLQAVLKQ